MITVTFIKPDGSRLEVQTEPGVTLLHLAQEQGLPLEGACEGNMACSTCHLVVEEGWYHMLPDMSFEEEDMLDLAAGLTGTSRLGCQIWLDDSLDGLVVTVPKDSVNMMGF